MTVITTVAELDALPVSTPVVDIDGDEWVKLPGGQWSMRARGGATPSRQLARLWAPFMLVEQPGLHMTRCVADSCANTIPLPPGSSWACADHQQHITLGRDS